jgi:hypothetical protein
MIAIPDFGAGAMENWGLITYRTQYMLYDPNVTTAGIYRFVAVIVAHELAHMVKTSNFMSRGKLYLRSPVCSRSLSDPVNRDPYFCD